MASLQVIFNTFHQKPLHELFPNAQAKGVGITARLPLASGLLTGKLTRETKFHADDHRNFNRDGAEFNVGETFAGLSYELGVDLSEEVTALAPAGMTTWPVSTPTRCKITSAGHTEQSKRDDRTTSGRRIARG